MAQSNINSNLHVSGLLTCGQFSPPAASITSDAISSPLGPTKTHPLRAITFALATTDVPADKIVPLHTVYGTSGTLHQVDISSYTVASATAHGVTVDVQRATAASTYVSLLSSALLLTSTDTARNVYNPTISTSGLASGDLLAIKFLTTGTSTNIGKGITITLHLSEYPI